MKSLEFYKGREQTYVKHYFLERYLELVAYNILSSYNEFVYVEGFSGPWKARDEAFGDTSFALAIEKLRRVQNKSRQIWGANKSIQCMFVERDNKAFAALQAYLKATTQISTNAVPGEFEASIPKLAELIGNRFCFLFIDPVGWTGFGLRAIQPLLKLKGEVLINLMSTQINRFHTVRDAKTAASFDLLFGGPDWFDEFKEILATRGVKPEQAVLETYTRRLKRFGGYNFVTSTRVKFPTKDRTYFHLIYATRHPKGVLVFRQVEKKAALEQEKAATIAREDIRADSSKEPWLFEGLPSDRSQSAFEKELTAAHTRGRIILARILARGKPIAYPVLRVEVLQTPLVWESELKDWLEKLRREKSIAIDGLRRRSLRPNDECVIRPLIT